MKGLYVAYLGQRNLIQHVPRPLHTEKFTCDPDHILRVSKVGTTRRGRVRANEPLKGRGKVDVSSCFLLDRLKCRSFSPCDNGMKFLVNLADFGMEAALKGRASWERYNEIEMMTHKLIQHHQ